MKTFLEFWGILKNSEGEVTMYREPLKGKEVSKEGKQWEKTIDHRGFFHLDLCLNEITGIRVEH